MFRPLGIGKKNKDDFEARMLEGLYVGHHERTSGLLILTENGLIAGKTFMRVPADRRWATHRGAEGGAGEVRGLPWDPKLDAAGTRVPTIAEGEERMVPIVAQVVVAPQQRDRYVLKADIEKYGATDGCPGCVSLAIHGKTGVRHSQECREHVGELMERDAEGGARVHQHQARREARRPAADPDRDEVPADEAAGAPAGGTPAARRRRDRPPEGEPETATGTVSAQPVAPVPAAGQVERPEQRGSKLDPRVAEPERGVKWAPSQVLADIDPREMFD